VQKPSVPPTSALVARREPSFQLTDCDVASPLRPSSPIALRAATPTRNRLLSAPLRQPLGRPPPTTGRGTAEHTAAHWGRAFPTGQTHLGPTCSLLRITHGGQFDLSFTAGPGTHMSACSPRSDWPMLRHTVKRLSTTGIGCPACSPS
jgi:hypothetical protein